VVVPPVEAEKPKERYHVVVKGDTLHGIAERYYGDGRFWREIYQANRGIINDPALLQVGWKLRIPSAAEIADKQQSEDTRQ